MVLAENEKIAQLAGQIRQTLADQVRMTQLPASEYPGFTYLKIYSPQACKKNMLKILQQRTGLEKVVTFGSIPGQYDVYVHDDGGNSAVKRMKHMVEGQKVR